MNVAQNVPSLFQETKKAWLEGARVVARRLLKTRSRITIEDVTKEYPLPDYLHRNTIGNVFNSRDFESVGFTTARNPAARGHVIRYWTLKESERLESDCDG